MKFLLWAVIVALFVFWLTRPKGLRPSGRTEPPAVGATEAMLQCAECGVHFPASEALPAVGGEVFCCDEHRRRHASRKA
jgi:uncharacterized protein